MINNQKTTLNTMKAETSVHQRYINPTLFSITDCTRKPLPVSDVLLSTKE